MKLSLEMVPAPPALELGAKTIQMLIGSHVDCRRVYQLPDSQQLVGIGDAVQILPGGESHGGVQKCYILRGI